MRVLDVRAVLDRERDIQLAGPKTKVLESLNFKNTKYAILSHRWEMEVDYDEMTGLMKMDDQDRDEIRQRKGYRKIIKSCEQALKDGYAWLWVDTCCIDKRSSAELSEAINSMYRWYRNAQRCYVYLNDVDGLAFPAEQDFSRFDKFHGWPEWFSRGWTLQELIAPREVEFFNKSWMSIGTKQDLTSTLQIITRIPEKVLRDGQVLRSTGSSERPGVAHIMSWAADRKTRRVEDRAYSLMGLFGVNMPMLYGEGSKAFQRLQLEIIRASSDRSIFAWNPKGCLGNYGSVLAEDPNCFRGCHDIENIVDHNEFADELKEYIRENGLDVDTHHGQGKLLSLRSGAASIQLSIFNVTNVGIQVWLPIIPDRDDSKSVFKAVLPCLDCDGNLITIDLESCGLSSSRCLGASRIRNTWPEFTSLYLAYAQDAEESYHDLRLNDRRASWNGFTRCGAFPCEILRTCNTVILSPEKSLIVLVYANNDAKSRFAVGLGYYLGEVWACVVCDECPTDQQAQSSWADFAKQAYDFLWNAPVDESYFCGASFTIKATHLPKSIWDARIVCGSNDNGYTDVMIDIEQCPGCCTGPCICRSLDDELRVPCTYTELLHELKLDGQSAWLQECSSQGIALGDYGHYSTHDGFNRRGNVFEDMQELGIDPIDSVYGLVVSRVSSCEHVLRCHDMP
ncbi:heterokaryon incompatibility protein-domain-containing protein [Pisolithus tinctorius]|nr:heterokaryon incompatibility protein-domain-containing protein [Pisolithus tinctorius]